jgi:lysozyme
MKASQSCIDLIKSFEGLRTEAYLDACGRCTIGFGHTQGVELGQEIDAEEAERLLAHDLDECAAAVNRLVKVPLTQGQSDAILSFAYNLGPGTLERSTLLRLLNAGRPDLAALEFPKWSHAGAKVLPGLVRRRAAEQQLFLS